MTTWTAAAGHAGLIFDCDGTLADTMPAHYKAWTAMLGRLGIPFPEPRFYAMGGMPTAQHHPRARGRGRRDRRPTWTRWCARRSKAS